MNKQEFALIREVYRQSLLEISGAVLMRFYQLDKCNASAKDWQHLSDQVYRIRLSCQLLEFEKLYLHCMNIEQLLAKPLAAFQLSQLTQIETMLIEMYQIARVCLQQQPACFASE